MEPSIGDPIEPGRVRGRGRRDVLVISLAILGLFGLGVALHMFDRSEDWIGKHAAMADDLLGVLLLSAVGIAVFAVRRWREAAHELVARAEVDQRARSLVEQIPAITYTWDPTKRAGEAPIPYVSPQIVDILGFTQEEWTGDPGLWIGQIHPEDRDRVIAASNDAETTGEPINAEYRAIAKDGRVVWIHDEAAVVERDARGRPLLVQGVMVDITERKRVEDRLTEAETRYRSLVEQLPGVTYRDGVSRANETDTTPVYISPQIEQLLGYTPEEWLTDPARWDKCVHPEDHDRVQDAGNAARRSGRPFRAEYRMVRRDGHIVWIQEESALVRDADGRPLFWQGLMTDMSERKRAEHQLREAEERLRTLVEQIPAVTYVEDPATGRTIYISPQILDMFGFTPEEWTADPHLWEERIHPDDREWVMADNAADTGGRWSVDYRTIAKDGRVVWIHNESVLVRDEYGNPLFWQGVVFDITERKRAEDRIREAEARYRTLVEQLPVAVYVDAVDDVSTALYISPQYERILGFTREERMADAGLWARQLHPDDREWVLAESIRTNETGEPFSVEYRMIAKDGRVVWLRDEAILLRDEDGGPEFWQGVLLEITEQKLAEETLSRRDAILSAVGFAAERFLKTGSWEESLPEVLTHLGTASHVSRVYVFENETTDDGSIGMTLRREWVAVDVGSLDDGSNLRHPYRDGFSRWERELSSGGSIFGLTRDFPPEEQEILVHEQVLSQAIVPIFVGRKWWGFLGFDDVEREREWSQADLDALKAAADTLGAAIGREQAERRIAETETRYRTLVEQMPAVTYIHDLQYETASIYISPRVEQMLGYTVDEWRSGRLWFDTIHPDDRERVLGEDRRTDQTGEPFSIEYRQLTKDGRIVWVRDEAALVRDGDGNALYWQGVRLDITARRQAEEQLREAEEQYRTLVERIPGIVYLAVFGEGAPWLYVSPQVETILGYSAEEWTANPRLWMERMHPDDLERTLAEEYRSRDTGEQLVSEYRMIARDGRTVWVRDEAEVVPGADGGPALLRGLMHDITERKRAEEQLAEAETRYRTLIETIPAVTYIQPLDRLTGVTYVSPQIEQMLGYPAEEWATTYDNWFNALHPDDRERVVAEDDRTDVSGEPFRIEYRLRHRDGSYVWVRDEAVLVRDENGEARFWQGVRFDITALKEAEGQLKEAEEKYRAIVEHIPAVLYVDLPDEALTPVYVSPQIEELLGVDHREYVSDVRHWQDRVHAEDREGAVRAIQEGVESGGPFSLEYRMVRDDGREIWIRDDAVVLHDEDGRSTMVQGVMTDITERKLAEQALRESERREREAAERLRSLDDMKNTFLAAVSHELRSPLTSILGLSLTLERQEMAAEDRTDLLGRLAANARKLDRLLKDLLDIDRLNRGIVSPQRRPTDVGALVRRTVESMDLVDGRSVLVETEPVVIPIDGPKVERIVENLLANAVRHTSNQVAVWVRVGPHEGGVLIAVEDDGPGVPTDIQQAIFEPFRQGPTASAHSPGTGIGLSLVAMFADLHGGRAWVQDREGGGASFRVFLPGIVENGHGDPETREEIRLDPADAG